MSTAIYMQAVTGDDRPWCGWPMTVFLTPDGQPFYGGTYFPDQPRGQMACRASGKSSRGHQAKRGTAIADADREQRGRGSTTSWSRSSIGRRVPPLH